MALVYCHTNKLNGKAYIGWTINTMEHRWSSHCKDARLGSDCLFHRALRKWGTSNEVWNHEVIEIGFTSDDFACEAEVFWIAHRKTNGLREGHWGYNMTDCGEGTSGFKHHPDSIAVMRVKVKLRTKNSMQGRKHKPESNEKNRQAQLGKKASDETREKMSVSATLRQSITDETRQKLSDANKGEKNAWFGKTGEEHPRFGTTQTEETKQLISKNHKGKGKGRHSQESINRAAAKNRGQKRTAETKKKLSDKRKQRKQKTSTPTGEQS